MFKYFLMRKSQVFWLCNLVLFQLEAVRVPARLQMETVLNELIILPQWRETLIPILSSVAGQNLDMFGICNIVVAAKRTLFLKLENMGRSSSWEQVLCSANVLMRQIEPKIIGLLLTHATPEEHREFDEVYQAAHKPHQLVPT